MAETAEHGTHVNTPGGVQTSQRRKQPQHGKHTGPVHAVVRQPRQLDRQPWCPAAAEATGAPEDTRLRTTALQPQYRYFVE